MLSTQRRQNPKRLLILLLHPGPRPLGMFEGSNSKRGGSDLKPIMLLNPLSRSSKSILATKVRQHPFQPSRPSPWGHAQPLGQRTQVALGGATPNPLAHAHQPKDAPPA